MSQTNSKSGGSSGGASLVLRYCQNGDHPSEIYLCNGLSIGRTKANSVRLEDDQLVSRSHASVEIADGGTAILRCVDPGARIFLGDSITVRELRLTAGVVFRIGGTQFECIPGLHEPFRAAPPHAPSCPYCGSEESARTVSDLYACSACGQRILTVTLGGGSRTPILVPAQYGAFQAERFMARGGMGLVLRGFAAAGSQPVAIKLLLRRGIDRRAADRFKQEIALMRRVRDAHVVKLLSYGVAGHAHKFNYLVAEWIEGRNLREIIAVHTQTGRLIDFEAAFRWFKQVCRGLAAIHAVGVVHRDIKPSNILIGADGDARVSDLGIAKSMDSDESAITATGEMPGTLEYMAPEQFGPHDAVDLRVDLYSLGVTYYELLTGHRPLGHYAAASSVNYTVPPWFDTIVDRLLAPDPDRRFSSAWEVLHDAAAPPLVLPNDRATQPQGNSSFGEPASSLVAAPPHAAPSDAAQPLPSTEVVGHPGDENRASQVLGHPASASGSVARMSPASSKAKPSVAFAAGAKLRGLWTRPRSSKAKSSAAKLPRKPKPAGDVGDPKISTAVKLTDKASGRTIPYWQHWLTLTIAYFFWQYNQGKFSSPPENYRPGFQQPIRTQPLAPPILPRQPLPLQPQSNRPMPFQSPPRNVVVPPISEQPPQPVDATTPQSRGADSFTNLLGMKLSLIPAGEFIMGSPDDEKGRAANEVQHRVQIRKPFYLGVYAVTQAEYRQVMDRNPNWFAAGGGGGEKVVGMDTSQFPVEQVTWDDAVEFCSRLSQREGKTYRLPTEAEWEYACRAGTTTPFSFGSSCNGQEANCDGDYPYGTNETGPNLGRTTPVGSYRPNAWGLYDMHGNVRQWCSDWYGSGYYKDSAAADPQGLAIGVERVLRGGSWYYTPAYSRCSYRDELNPTYRGNDVGFRVVCER